MSIVEVKDYGAKAGKDGWVTKKEKHSVSGFGGIQEINRYILLSPRGKSILVFYHTFTNGEEGITLLN